MLKGQTIDVKWLLKIGVLCIVFLALFYPTYSHLFTRFNARDSYYSHGFLIPFVCLYLVFRKKDKLLSIKPESEPAGLFIILAGVLFYIISSFLKINFFTYLAIPVSILGIVLYLGGKKITKELLFPISFLFFMLPLPKVVIIGISFKLKLMVAQVATFLALNMGVQAERVGSTIYYPGGELLVGDPCSGLRSLVTFLALGALCTQFTKARLWRRTALFVSAIPIALLSNLTRITFLVMVSYIYGEKVALGFLHDFSGIMVFVLGFVCLIGASKLLRCSFVS